MQPALMGARSTSFNPLLDVPWHAAYWADDPAWSHPADGAAVSSWRDGSGGTRHAVQATGGAQPLFIASSINGKGAVRFDGVDDVLYAAFGATKAQPVTFVAVAKFAAVPSTTRRIMGTGGSTSRGIGSQGAGGNWAYNYATAATAGTVNTSAHFLRSLASGVSSSLFVDGTSTVTGDGGTGGVSAVSLGGGSTTTGPAFGSYWAGDLAFAGYCRGDLSTLAAFADLKAWVTAQYGITIA